MSSNFFGQDEEEEFRDVPDEVNGNNTPTPQIKHTRPPVVQAPVVEEQYEEEYQEEVEEDFSSILMDARFRLELGRLYEMLMNHNIFDGADANVKAMDYVTKQIRSFANDQMQIMLGMKQETPKNQPISNVDFPFNDLEVQTLKALASAATKGASASADAQQYSGAQQAPKRVGLNSIGVKPSSPVVKKPEIKPIQQKVPQKPLQQKPQAPIKRQKNEDDIDRILREEGISREQYDKAFPPTHKELNKPVSQMSEQELIERSKNMQYKKAVSASAIPMPSADQEEMIYMQRSPGFSTPGGQALMNALLKNK